jgi:hypothetical protein
MVLLLVPLSSQYCSWLPGIAFSSVHLKGNIALGVGSLTTALQLKNGSQTVPR